MIVGDARSLCTADEHNFSRPHISGRTKGDEDVAGLVRFENEGTRVPGTRALTGAKIGATAKLISRCMTTTERCKTSGDERATSGIEGCRHGHGGGRRERKGRDR